jgi:catalase-peroxidase
LRSAKLIGGDFGRNQRLSPASTVGAILNWLGTLTNDFLVNLLDMRTKWQPLSDGVYEGKDRATGKTRWTGARVDLVFGSNSQLRAIADAYGLSDAKETFARDFAAA